MSGKDVECDNCGETIDTLNDTYVSVEYMNGVERERGWFFCDDTCFLANYKE